MPLSIRVRAGKILWVRRIFARIHLQKFGEFLLSLAIVEVSLAIVFYFHLATLVEASDTRTRRPIVSLVPQKSTKFHFHTHNKPLTFASTPDGICLVK